VGLIQAVKGAVGGTLADQWLDAIAIPAALVEQDTILVHGRAMRDDQRSRNNQGTEGIISNGSRIAVPTAATLLLVDGGRIVDYTAEPGYYTVDDSAQPSLLAGQFGDSFRQAWERFKFAGGVPQRQEAVYVLQREIRDIKFGTKQPIQYFDTFYNAELFLRTFGSFTIMVNNPILFYGMVYDKVADRVNFRDIQSQFVGEFLTKLTTAIAQLSGQGVRVSAVQQHQDLLAQAMAQLLDDEWTQRRGIDIQAVSIESVSYTDESRDLINLRNKGAMLSDAAIQRGYVAGQVADGMAAAGANPQGGGAAMMGLGFAGGAVGGLFGPLVPPAQGGGAAGGADGGPTPTQPPAQPLVPVPGAGSAPAPAAAPAAPAAPPAPAAAPPAGAPATAATANPSAAGTPAGSGTPATPGAPAGAEAGPRFCPDCGTPTGGARFCPNCGRQLRA
jgi:membrane protease subunit (stomatin/prohibitin family)